MPTDTGRALSIQQQYALELIAEQAAAMAAALMLAASQSTSRAEAEALTAQYAVLLTGAMMAVARTRVGYLQAFALAEGVPAFDVAEKVLQPTVFDVIVGGDSPLPAPQGVGANVPPMPQTPLRVPSEQGAMWAALTDLQTSLEEERPDALPRAQAMIAESTESTVTSTVDWVDSMVLGPSPTVAGLRRVAHPTACDRCRAVSGVLTFKTAPRLRHPQCRCSFEPVLVGDPEYRARIARYQGNANFNVPGPYARDRRYRGRQQLAAAEFRTQDEFTQDMWAQFLKDEQTRLGSLVTSIPSNTYRDWAVMVSANITTANVGGDLLPVITRS